MSKHFDLSRRGWGNNYNILSIIDKGQKLKLAVWMPSFPEHGDYLILKDEDRTTRYKVDAIKTFSDPRDMAIVDTSFAPRETPDGN